MFRTNVGLLLLFIVLGVASCSPRTVDTTPLDYMETVASTDLSAEAYEGAALGESVQELIGKLGDPLEKIELAEDRLTVMRYAAASFSMRDGKVIGYMLSPGGRTERGMQPGDPVSAIAEAYGNEYFERRQDTTTLIGYIDKNRRHVLEFAVNGDTIATIIASELSYFEAPN